MKKHLMNLLMPILPKRDLSHWVGRAVHRRIPGPLGPASVEFFAKAYGIDLNEAERPIAEYKTIGELFARRLKPGVRPIGLWPVHPCDGVITECGPIEKLQLIQAKGKSYSVPELLRSSREALPFEGGSFFTYYLCPTDYHRVHSPVDGRLSWICHAPGELWPVNAWSVGAISNLFSVNERVSMAIETPRGRAAISMVAATNVGNITLAFDDSVATNARSGSRAPKEKRYDPAKELRTGDELGVFRMGSTVVALFQKGFVPPDAFAHKGKRVRMGEPLISQ